MLAAVVLTASSAVSEHEPACRCAPLDLAEYWTTADEVTMARLVAHDETERYRTFRMVLEAQPWKADRPAVLPMMPGDTVEYRTAVSTASCGVQPEPGAVYVVFGRRSPSDAVLDVDTCSGTRVHRSAVGEEVGGFQDVPGRFVVRQLDALAGLASLAGLAPLPDPSDTERAVLRGLLDLEPLAHGGVVRIFERPEPTAPVLAAIDAPAGVMTREVDYELPAAVVFGRVGGWSRVRLADGRPGWIAPEDAGTWFPYADLPVRRLAYLTPAWGGWVWPGPGSGIPTRVRRLEGYEREQPVEVLESQMVGGVPWFRVSVLGGSTCDGTGDRPALAAGWLPAYGTRPDTVGLRPTAWYWSRGC